MLEAKAEQRNRAARRLLVALAVAAVIWMVPAAAEAKTAPNGAVWYPHGVVCDAVNHRLTINPPNVRSQPGFAWQSVAVRYYLEDSSTGRGVWSGWTVGIAYPLGSAIGTYGSTYGIAGHYYRVYTEVLWAKGPTWTTFDWSWVPDYNQYGVNLYSLTCRL